MRPDSTSTCFSAMGGEARVLVAGGPQRLLDRARRRVADLEGKWSRFRAHSEITRLNTARHRTLAVSSDTRLLLERSIAAWSATGGAFDPTVLDALIAWGYDRDFSDLSGRAVEPARAPTPGLGAVEIDHVAGTASLGGSAGFDPGGIGKGLAADLVACELVESGAHAALVNISGDLRIAGTPPGDGWSIGVEDPLAPDHDLVRMSLTGGGVATSSDRRHRWPVADGDAHHLIDPSTCRPVTSDLASVSVLAGEAWWAEALTKAVLVGGLPVTDLTPMRASGIGRSRAGHVVGTPDLLSLGGQAA